MGIETLAVASLATSVIGGAVSAFGAVQQGQAAQAAANYRAQIARNMAKHAELVGQAEAQKQGFKTSAILGAQTAAQASSGLDVNTGSPVDIRATAAKMGELDTLTILNNTRQRVWALENQATLDEFSGKQSALEGWLKATGSVLGTASGVSDKWMKFKTTGVNFYG